jgi:hypothetical protein
MGKVRTYPEIAADYDLWMEFADPHPDLDREAFQALSLEEKILRQVAAYGPEPERRQIRDLERILSLLDGWETEAAVAVRIQAEEGLDGIMGWSGRRRIPG